MPLGLKRRWPKYPRTLGTHEKLFLLWFEFIATTAKGQIVHERGVRKQRKRGQKSKQRVWMTLR